MENLISISTNSYSRKLFLHPDYTYVLMYTGSKMYFYSFTPYALFFSPIQFLFDIYVFSCICILYINLILSAYFFPIKGVPKESDRNQLFISTKKDYLQYLVHL